MTDDQEHQLIRESSRGSKAQAWLSSEITKDVFSVLEADTLEKWKNSPVRDEEGQRVLRLKWQVIQEMRKYVTDIAYTGKMAEQTLNHERSLKDRALSVVKRFVK